MSFSIIIDRYIIISLFKPISLGPFKNRDYTSESRSSKFQLVNSLGEILKLEGLNQGVHVVLGTEFKHFLQI